MAPSEIATETIILHLREGSDLKNVEAGADNTFMQLTNIVKGSKRVHMSILGNCPLAPHQYSKLKC